jgi:hypothetical protein
MVEALLSVIGALLGLRQQVFESSTEKRARTAAYLLEVSRCVEELATLAIDRKTQLMALQCAQLDQYLTSPPDTVREYLGSQKFASFASMADRARGAPRDFLFSMQFSREAKARGLLQAAGQLKAFAHAVAAG